MASLVILARVAYIICNGGNDLEGDFAGFKWLSAFLYSFGVEVAMILVGITINYSTRFMEKKAKKPFNYFGWSVQMVGFYYMFWIFLDESVFTIGIEMLFSLILSIISIIIQQILYKFFKNHTNDLKSKISYLMNLMVVKSVDGDHIKDKKGYTKDIINPAIDKLSE